MEAHWETAQPAGMSLLLWPDEANERNSVEALTIPGLLSLLAFNDPSAEVKGLKAFPKDERPPVLLTFLSFRLMIALGTLFPILGVLAWFWSHKAEEKRRFLRLLPWVIPLPYFAIWAGWMLAEVGRQPWIVYRVMRTSDAVSPTLSSTQVALSLAAFIVVYGLLGAVCIYLLQKFARQGPAAA
jgi:cytochrome d ubiquinol oxidase subunit I